MKKAFTLIIVALFVVVSYGQNFEGKVVYRNSYKSKIPNVSDAQLTQMMGSMQEYFIKDGNYKSILNGSLFQWQLYVNKDNKLYSKMANSETLLWNDGLVNADEVLKVEVKKDVTEILGYKCDELVFILKDGTERYFFNLKLFIDPALFANHKLGNWYKFLSISKSLPLKSIIEKRQFTVESVATEIKEMKLESKLFELPAGIRSMKGPN